MKAVLDTYPVACPVCGMPSVRKLFDDGSVRVSAEMNGELRDVSGLAVFMCANSGHVFMVRISDLQSLTGQTADRRAVDGLSPR